jgi:hypothetical protein
MGITPAALWEMDPSGEQIDLMVAFAEVEHEIGPHGMPMSEATDPHAAPGYYEDGAYRYQATLVPDWAQFAINAARTELQKEQGKDADISHYRAVVERVDY